MTGFGSAIGRVGNVNVTVEVRTVNHRFFTPTIKLPSAFAPWEAEVREAIRSRVSRGHVTLFVRAEREEASASISLVIDDDRVANYASELRVLQARHGLAGDVDLATVLRLPGVIRDRPVEEMGGTSAELLVLVEAAGDALTSMRDSEGARLADVLAQRIELVDQAVQRIAARAPVRVIEHRDRLRTAVRELTDGIAIDEPRVAVEIALLADRLDVGEEMDRFGSHLVEFRNALLATTGEPVGKRLGFLLQEMLREANTTGSKANDAIMLRDVVVIKEELERIREQVENLE